MPTLMQTTVPVYETDDDGSYIDGCHGIDHTLSHNSAQDSADGRGGGDGTSVSKGDAMNPTKATTDRGDANSSDREMIKNMKPTQPPSPIQTAQATKSSNGNSNDRSNSNSTIQSARNATPTKLTLSVGGVDFALVPHTSNWNTSDNSSSSNAPNHGAVSLCQTGATSMTLDLNGFTGKLIVHIPEKVMQAIPTTTTDTMEVDQHRSQGCDSSSNGNGNNSGHNSGGSGSRNDGASTDHRPNQRRVVEDEPTTPERLVQSKPSPVPRAGQQYNRTDSTASSPATQVMDLNDHPADMDHHDGSNIDDGEGNHHGEMDNRDEAGDNGKGGLRQQKLCFSSFVKKPTSSSALKAGGNATTGPAKSKSKAVQKKNEKQKVVGTPTRKPKHATKDKSKTNKRGRDAKTMSTPKRSNKSLDRAGLTGITQLKVVYHDNLLDQPQAFYYKLSDDLPFASADIDAPALPSPQSPPLPQRKRHLDGATAPGQDDAHLSGDKPSKQQRRFDAFGKPHEKEAAKATEPTPATDMDQAMEEILQRDDTVDTMGTFGNSTMSSHSSEHNGAHQQDGMNSDDARFNNSSTQSSQHQFSISSVVIQDDADDVCANAGSHTQMTIDGENAAEDAVGRPDDGIQSTAPPCPRWGHSATALQDGRVLVHGGQAFANHANVADDDQEDSAIMSDVHIFDPKTKAWSAPVMAAGDPRKFHTATYLPERNILLCFGGETFQHVQNAKHNQPGKYSLSTSIVASSEASKAPLSASTTKAAQTAAAESKKIVVTNSLRVLDTELMLWYPPATSGVTPGGRAGHSATLLPHTNQLVVFAGSNGACKWYNTVSVLDTHKWVWKRVNAKGILPEARSYHSATAVLSNPGAMPNAKKHYKIVIFGGNNETKSFNTVHVLEPPPTGGTSKAWRWSHPQVRGKAPFPRTDHSATLLEDGKTICIYGGWDPNAHDDDNDDDSRGSNSNNNNNSRRSALQVKSNIFKASYLLDTTTWTWSIGPKPKHMPYHRTALNPAISSNDAASGKQQPGQCGGRVLDCGAKRCGHATVWDAGKSEIIAFGGQTPGDRLANDMQVLSFAK